MARIKFSNYAAPLIIAALVIAGVIVALAFGGSQKPKPQPKTQSAPTVNTACGPYRKDGVVTINTSQINVEIAYDSKAKATGLAGRPCLDTNWGMFFDFGHDGQYAFWMKGVNFPIDIIWINSAHNVAAVETDVEPSTYHSANPYFENDPQHLARYVLELKANRANDLKLELGTPVHFQKS